MKAIVYSLFGYDREKPDNCFSFDSYLIGLMLSIRFNRLVYPEWQTVLETEKATYAAFEPLFHYLKERGILRIELNTNGAKLCEAMLWRMKPVFWTNAFGKWEFSHVLCRDLDSLSTYRDAQAVQTWVTNDKAVHAITDSVSHDVPMLGGMIGFRPDHFTAKANIKSFTELMNKCNGNGIELSIKGSDQTFLNGIIYPLIAEKGTDAITQHYFKGHGKTWLSDFHTCNCWIDQCAVGHKDGCPLNIQLGLPDEMRETNEISQHLGASGWNQPQAMRLIEKHKDKFQDLLQIEKDYSHIFYWAK